MKTILMIVLSVITTTLFAQKNEPIPSAQIESVSLKADGLTCSMCSKAIYKSLLKVATVKEVEPDIKNSSYTIYFKKDQLVKLEELEKAVEDAGFSVASIKVNRKNNSVKQ